MKYFMQASSNKTGRKNGATIWITSEQSIFRTKALQNNWKDTLRCIISGTIRTNGERTHKKPSKLPRGSGPREARLAFLALTQLEMVLRGEPNLSFKIPNNGITNNQRKRMPRETEKHSLMMSGGKQIGGPRLGGRNQDVSGTTKFEFFFLTQDSAPT